MINYAIMLSEKIKQAMLYSIYLIPIWMPYKESKQYLRNYQKYQPQTGQKLQDVEGSLLQHVLTTTPKNNPFAVLQAINAFCRQHWMMNVGEDKGQILANVLKKVQPKTILELGGYCGFSGLLMAANSNAIVHTIQPNERVASIAHQIHEHAGLGERIVIHLGVLQSLQAFVKNHGKFDFIFIDHIKTLYLQDLKELERLGAVQQGTTVFGDNIIHPGSPDYHEYMRNSNNYDTTLYFSYLEYSDRPDAVLVSLRIAQ